MIRSLSILGKGLIGAPKSLPALLTQRAYSIYEPDYLEVYSITIPWIL